MQKKKERLPKMPVTLDEFIVIAKFDTDYLTYEKIGILQDL